MTAAPHTLMGTGRTEAGWCAFCACGEASWGETRSEAHDLHGRHVRSIARKARIITCEMPRIASSSSSPGHPNGPDQHERPGSGGDDAGLRDDGGDDAQGSPMPETEGARAEGYAPAWVQSVTPAEVVRQRRLGWPDFHPEDFCHVCGHRIGAPWFVSAETWGKVFDGHAGIVCPPCFTTLYAAATGSDRVGWELRVDHQEGDS